MRSLLYLPSCWLGLVICVVVPSAAPAQTPARLDLRVTGGLAQLSVASDVNSTWAIQYNADPGNSAGWLPFTNITLAVSPTVVTHPAGPGTGLRVYRAVADSMPTNVVATNMVWVMPGSFVMGSPLTEADRLSDETQHSVTLTRGFFIGRFLVTQGEYLTVMSNNPSSFPGDIHRPVESLHWYAASAYCAQLTQRERQAGRLPANWGYRLPTEAEWEYACRAGTTTRFSYGEDPGYAALTGYAWFNGNSGGLPQAVGQKLPNALGLRDMHGNVYQWCQDWYGDYPAGPVADPQGPPSGLSRVFRGGSFLHAGQFCRSAGRYAYSPTAPLSYVGFRLVLAATP